MKTTLATASILAFLAVWAGPATAQDGMMCVNPPDCDGDMMVPLECVDDTECAAGDICDVYGSCVPEVVSCTSDLDCRAGEYCVFYDYMTPDAPTDGDACYDCDPMPYPSDGICEVNQQQCGEELCDPGYECASTGQLGVEPECTPKTVSCLTDDECLDGWSCKVPDTIDGVRCAGVMEADPGPGQPAPPRCFEPPVCVPDGGNATCEGAVCTVFTAEETPSSGSKRNDGCTVSMGSSPAPSSALVLLIGLGLMGLRRR